MFDIRRYTPDRADEWNAFISRSKNGTFLFDRRYMDYHASRFKDHSLMFYDRKGLYAVLPANEADGVLHTHQGLTYGGLVLNERATTETVCNLFRQMNDLLRNEGFHGVEYKAVPWIYHRLPSEEALYALFLVCGASLSGRDIASTVVPSQAVKWRRDRRYAANKAFRNGIIVDPSDDYAAFWQVLTDNLLSKYGVPPVHSLEEMLLLSSRFPRQIRLYVARHEGKVVGGTVLYDCGQTIHSQYISASPEGKRLHAIDAIYERVLLQDYADRHFVDFGKSTEGHGYGLNTTLIAQKEGFGGRGVCYDTYEWSL